MRDRRQRAGHVLLVDVKPKILAMVGCFLRGRGLRVGIARGGEETLAALSFRGHVDQHGTV